MCHTSSAGAIDTDDVIRMRGSDMRPHGSAAVLALHRTPPAGPDTRGRTGQDAHGQC